MLITIVFFYLLVLCEHDVMKRKSNVLKNTDEFYPIADRKLSLAQKNTQENTNFTNILESSARWAFVLSLFYMYFSLRCTYFHVFQIFYKPRLNTTSLPVLCELKVNNYEIVTKMFLIKLN